MKKVILFTAALLVMLVVSGCSSKEPEPKIVVKMKYIQQMLPKIQDKPIGKEYRTLIVKFNEKEYYAIPRVDGSIMSNNWIIYKEWSENNYNLLLDIKKNVKDINTTK